MRCWLRRSFLAGLVVTVPLLITVVTLVWFFRFIDGVARPLSMAVLGREVPGLGVLMTAGFILLTGAVATNVIGRRMLQRTEKWLLSVPLFKTVYAPVKQLVAAFSPDSETGFKKVVVIDDARARDGVRVPDARVHVGSRQGSGSDGGGVRADQSPVSR